MVRSCAPFGHLSRAYARAQSFGAFMPLLSRLYRRVYFAVSLLRHNSSPRLRRATVHPCPAGPAPQRRQRRRVSAPVGHCPAIYIAARRSAPPYPLSVARSYMSNSGATKPRFCSPVRLTISRFCSPVRYSSFSCIYDSAPLFAVQPRFCSPVRLAISGRSNTMLRSCNVKFDAVFLIQQGSCHWGIVAWKQRVMKAMLRNCNKYWCSSTIGLPSHTGSVAHVHN